MKEKLKAFGLPIGITLIFITALFIHQLLLVKEFPDSGWSRSLSFEESFKEKPQIFVDGNGKIHIASDGHVKTIQMNKELAITEESTSSTKITRCFPFWTDGNRYIYYKGGNLVSSRYGLII
jgi:hypothetical protein